MTSYTWTAEGACTGASDDSWGAARNWSPQAVPGDGDSVTVPDVDYNGDGFDSGVTPNNIPTVNLSQLTLGELGLLGGSLTVSDMFTWTGGSISDNTTITVAGTGRISGLTGAESQPTLVNDSALVVSGSLLLTNGQLGFVAGGTLTVRGNVTLLAAGFTSFGGSAATIRNTGAVSVSGACVVSEGVVLHHAGGTITVAAAATLSIGEAATLFLDGGAIVGSGVVRIDGSGSFGQPGGGSGGTVVPNTSTTIANVVLAVGTIDPPTQPTSTAALSVSSTFTWSGGELDGHLILTSTTVSTIAGAVLQAGRLDNAGRLTVSPTGWWQFEGSTPPALSNSGRIVLSGAGSIISNANVAATNTGVIEKTGTGTTSTVGIVIASTGGVVVTSGTLTLSSATLTVAGGQLRLAGTRIADDSGFLQLSGGTAGGVLAGWGTVDVDITNSGWIEPSQSGFTFSSNYTQTTEGNIVLPPSALTGGAAALLRCTGGNPADLAGSLWGLS